MPAFAWGLSMRCPVCILVIAGLNLLLAVLLGATALHLAKSMEFVVRIAFAISSLILAANVLRRRPWAHLACICRVLLLLVFGVLRHAAPFVVLAVVLLAFLLCKRVRQAFWSTDTSCINVH
jgi:hypothetical protein